MMSLTRYNEGASETNLPAAPVKGDNRLVSGWLGGLSHLIHLLSY